MIARDPFQRYKRVGHAMALAILAVVCAEFYWNFRTPTDRDFISFWGAAQVLLAGRPAEVYDMEALRAVQAGVVTFVNGSHMPYPYPPLSLLFVAPFGLLPFPVAIILWGLATFTLYIVVVRRAFPRSGWLAAAFPAVFVNAAIGQNAFLTAAIFVGGLALLPKRPLAAGVVLGCLVVKPQLGLMLPFALLAAREWRAIAGAALSAAGVLLTGLILFGMPATLAWLNQLPLYIAIGRDGLSGWDKLASVYAAMRQAGLPMGWSFVIHCSVALAAAAAVWRIWRSPADHWCKAAALAAATLLASPYIYGYDALLAVVAFFWLATAGAPTALLAILWCLPLVSIAQIAGPLGSVNLGPLVPIGLLALIVRQARIHSVSASPVIRAPALA